MYNSFTLLTNYLKYLEKARASASAASSCIPEKRPAKEDGEAKKKVKVSQGVKALGKVNTRGMKDMRSFFNKKPVKS